MNAMISLFIADFFNNRSRSTCAQCRFSDYNKSFKIILQGDLTLYRGILDNTRQYSKRIGILSLILECTWIWLEVLQTFAARSHWYCTDDYWQRWRFETVMNTAFSRFTLNRVVNFNDFAIVGSRCNRRNSDALCERRLRVWINRNWLKSRAFTANYSLWILIIIHCLYYMILFGYGRVWYTYVNCTIGIII